MIGRFGYDLRLAFQLVYILLFIFKAVESWLLRLRLDISSVSAPNPEGVLTSSRTGIMSLTSAAAYKKESQISIVLGRCGHGVAQRLLLLMYTTCREQKRALPRQLHF